LQLPAIDSNSSITEYYRKGRRMETTSVTSKGQVTIPKELRQRLGIRRGTRVEFSLVGDHLEMRVRSSPTEESASGFGLLKSRRASVPADLDPASLIKR
jgi:AbrB family looped-hinge helix DNA binding protein